MTDEPDVTLRRARADEAEALTSLALRSKAHWGYSRDFMEACRAELTVAADDLASGSCRTVVAERSDRLLGFYTIAPTQPSEFELDALFVEPEAIGTGVGRLLLADAIRVATSAGARRLTIQGDPNATRFYEAAGAVRIGERGSESIPGRQLPLFVVPLAMDGCGGST